MAASSQIDANSGLNDNLKKPLAELKVTDLRNELERRSLDKNGIKSVLVDRLTAVSDSQHGQCLTLWVSFLQFVLIHLYRSFIRH